MRACVCVCVKAMLDAGQACLVLPPITVRQWISCESGVHSRGGEETSQGTQSWTDQNAVAVTECLQIYLSTAAHV